MTWHRYRLSLTARICYDFFACYNNGGVNNKTLYGDTTGVPQEDSGRITYYIVVNKKGFRLITF